ncbi:MAG: TAT-variant-translocated molybdopterin oxidoreductase [Flavisolibacter sp.]
MSDKKYWTSFAALNHKEELKKLNENEFGEDLPFEDLNDKGLLDAKTPRRDFLKYLGFSTAAATLAASCKQPVRKAIPFVNRPENIVPGVSKYYASTYVQDGDALPILVKVRDGRPIKIEGNDLCSFTQGGTSARAQASVLDLYDTYRITNPKRKVGSIFQEIPTFEQLDTQITSALSGLGGAPVVLLTSTIVSPSTKQLISEFLGRFPGSRHVQYDAVSYSGMIQANGGKIPSYQLDKAKVIVSLGADFLGTWLAPVEFARQYSAGRKIDQKNPQMSKHYQFESYLSMTGANADERFTHRPSETGAVALALLSQIGGGAAPQLDAKLAAGIKKVADDLKANRGDAVVVSGSNDVNVQRVVNAINSAIGAFGSVINSAVSLNYRQGIDSQMVDLVNQMNNGQVGALLIYGANPAYDFFDAAKFKTGLSKVRLSVSFNEKMDETTELCNYVVPSHHYLESWGDAEPRTGYISFLQPTINPLFKTRAFQTSLLKWGNPSAQVATPQTGQTATTSTANNTEYETYFRTYWEGRLGGQQNFDLALQDGVLQNGRRVKPTSVVNPAAYIATDTINANGTTTSFAIVDTTRAVNTNFTNTQQTAGTGAIIPQGDLQSSITALTAGKKGTGNELVLYQMVSLGTGKQAGNPWLLELPDPITKSTWDNFAMISTAKAKELGINYQSTEYEYYTEKPLIEITVNGKTHQLPALVVPGMDPNTIAVAVGHGRSEKFAKAVFYADDGITRNAYQFARFNGTNIDYTNDVTTSAKAVGDYKIARIQVHDSYEGRTEVVKETTMGTFKARPTMYKEWRDDLHKKYSAGTNDYRQGATMYPDHVQPGPKWGMNIDMNLCIGCHACVVACHTENNVPVVGKNEVLRAHEMHWLRIDRYFVSNEENPDELETVIFQPMLCQHCDNAPCENVCPVAATMHSAEGINQMAYNRCIGTRYCANNCPYKVRRFNWSDYTGASTHGKYGPDSGVGKLNDVVHQMNDELTRMVLNPDVVTRSRGVMEKCTFCIQRTQEGKLKAKMENRELGANEVITACAQACPTSAITFGNVNKPESTVAQIRRDNQNREFYVLEQIHTLPNISYLAKIRNTDEVIVDKKSMGGHAADQKSEAVPTEHNEPAKTH